MIRRPPRSTLSSSSAASDVYKRQWQTSMSPACSRFTQSDQGFVQQIDAATTVNVPAVMTPCGSYRQQPDGFCSQRQKIKSAHGAESESGVLKPKAELRCEHYRHGSKGFSMVAVVAPEKRRTSVKRASFDPMGYKGSRFEAPDGTVFDNESEYRKYVATRFHSFKNRKGEKLVKGPGELKGQSFDLSELADCEVLLLDPCGQVMVDRLVNCRVFIGACSHDVFLRECVDCTFTVGCRQLRTRSCADCVINTYCVTGPVIEMSTRLTFRRYNGAYPRLGSHFERAGLDPSKNKWGSVFDFSSKDSTYEQPHFVVEDKHVGEDWVVDASCGIKGLKGKPENPVPKNASRLGFVNSGMAKRTSTAAGILGKKKKDKGSKGFVGGFKF
eukprot:TRINITY_DN17459_c0_g1_i1.p1 TRINITY_DN17459_c0_g1~~TRINITY_DN17459_c0_g1_i1.p1  ORF type:complete len:385 (+),score=89.90 TRINITY_DN17459_c0_g1_i1:110-1264(+)